jgi:hypothetical protein
MSPKTSPEPEKWRNKCLASGGNRTPAVRPVRSSSLHYIAETRLRSWYAAERSYVEVTPSEATSVSAREALHHFLFLLIPVSLSGAYDICKTPSHLSFYNLIDSW